MGFDERIPGGRSGLVPVGASPFAEVNVKVSVSANAESPWEATMSFIVPTPGLWMIQPMWKSVLLAPAAISTSIGRGP